MYKLILLIVPKVRWSLFHRHYLYLRISLISAEVFNHQFFGLSRELNQKVINPDWSRLIQYVKVSWLVNIISFKIMLFLAVALMQYFQVGSYELWAKLTFPTLLLVFILYEALVSFYFIFEFMGFWWVLSKAFSPLFVFKKMIYFGTWGIESKW